MISLSPSFKSCQVKLLLDKQSTEPKARTICACGEFPLEPRKKKKHYDNASQNIDLPTAQPKRKKKPFVVPVDKMVAEARKARALAEKGIDKPLEPPKNGILVPDLIPVAHTVLENWKVLIKGLSQLLTVVSVYGCRYGFWHQYEPCNDALTVVVSACTVGKFKKQ
jgi:APO RNA-binding